MTREGEEKQKYKNTKDAYGRDILQPGPRKARNITMTYHYAKFQVSWYNSPTVSLSYNNKYSAILLRFKSDPRTLRIYIYISTPSQSKLTFLWCNRPTGSQATSLFRFLDHTRLDTHTR